MLGGIVRLRLLVELVVGRILTQFVHALGKLVPQDVLEFLVLAPDTFSDGFLPGLAAVPRFHVCGREVGVLAVLDHGFEN